LFGTSAELAPRQVFVASPLLIDASAAVLAELEFTHLVKPMRDGGWRAEASSAREFQEELERWKRKVSDHPLRIAIHSSYLVTVIFGPSAVRRISLSFYAQTLANQAVIACALERYRIEKGSYPESLDDVSVADGKPLPLDMMTGRPLSYRKTPNGKYALWSVALNGKDHGGKRVMNKERPERTMFPARRLRGRLGLGFPREVGWFGKARFWKSKRSYPRHPFHAMCNIALEFGQFRRIRRGAAKGAKGNSPAHRAG
jgi:hypothetical protein